MKKNKKNAVKASVNVASAVAHSFQSLKPYFVKSVSNYIE